VINMKALECLSGIRGREWGRGLGHRGTPPLKIISREGE
jgi:hypothetical protein